MYTINYVLSYIFILWAITPLVNRRFYLAIPICLLWSLSSIPILKKNSKWKKENIYLLFSILGWICIEFFYRFFGVSTASIGNYAVRLCFWFSLIMVIFYLNNNDYHHLKNITAWGLTIIFLNAVDNIRLSKIYPQLVSGEITQIDQQGIDLKNNIAFTSFSIVAVICALICLSIFLQTKILKNKITASIVFIVLIIVNQAMSRGASTLILIIGILLLLLSKLLRKFNNRSKYILIMCITLLILFSYFGIINNANFIVSLIPNQRVALRIRDMLTRNQSSSFMSRIICLQISWNTFTDNLHNFIWGIGYHTIPIWTRENAAAIGIGYHTSIIDL